MDQKTGPRGRSPLKLERSLSDQVYRYLRQAILRHELTPGMQLKATELSAQHQVSPTPVREALMRLVSEGFVEATPQRRYCVARPSARRVHEAFELRLLTESYALPSAVNSARQAPARWVRLLDRSKELLKRGVEGKDDAVRATMLDEALHKAIVASARNNRLLQVWQRERDVTSMAYALSTRQAFGLDDHVALLSAIIGGDGQSARTTLAKHLREASRNMTVEEQAPYDTRRGGQE